MTIDAQCKDVKARLDAAEKARGLSEQNSKKADDLILSAGLQLQKIRAVVGDNRGKKSGVVTWVQVCAKIGISDRRSYELMEIAGGATTPGEQRERKAESMRQSRAKPKTDNPRHGGADYRGKKPSKPADCDDSACNFDWKNPKPGDFGDPSKMYRSQAQSYRTEATHLAESYPLLAPGVSPAIVTKTEIQAAQKVANAWLDVVTRLEKISLRTKQEKT